MARTALTLAAACMLSALMVHVARAEEVTLHASEDTTLYESDPGSSNGAGQHFFVGYNGAGSRRRALLRFDVAGSVPAGSKITRAALLLRLSRAQARETMIEVHRLQGAWHEGASRAAGQEGGGAPASEGEPTWSHRTYRTNAWNALGGDFASELSASLAVSDLNTYTWTSPQLAQDVQSFLDHPEQSFGWLLLGDANSSGAAKRFDSHENVSGTGPSLTVTFEPPDLTLGACCLPDGDCGIGVDGKACAAGATYMGAGTRCEPGLCPEPTGACCSADAAGSCNVSSRRDCRNGSFLGVHTSCEPNECPVILTPFVDKLPIPAVATPKQGKAGGAASYDFKMVQLKQKLHRDLPETTVWGYSDGTSASYPGPTIVARSGEAVDVTWTNDLRDQAGNYLTRHPLTVDRCLHGAEFDDPRTVVHLHGGHVPAEFDGQPELTLLPGESTHYVYPNKQRAATLWYHDHAVGITRLNVIMGLAGFYLLRDAEEDALGLPAGPYEIGLALQDRDFNPDGSFRYPAKWQESFFGHNPLVNGKVAPYLEVERGAYRFHVLNGSTSRVYTLSLASKASFVQLGTDGGLLRESNSMKTLTLAPGERADIIIDFTYASSEDRLLNSARAPYPDGGGGVDLPELMKFVVSDRPGHRKLVPVQLSRTLEETPTNPKVALERTLELTRVSSDKCGSGMWTINGKDWHDVTEFPHLGTREVWKFVNRSGVMHPMHMHMLFFQVLDRQQLMLKGDELVAKAPPHEPDRREVGWKDTVQVGPFEAVRVLASFEDYEGSYPYHCHLLEHEDHGMMRQFTTQAVCGDGARARGFEECDDGNVKDGDGCDSKCRNSTRERTQASDGDDAGPAAEPSSNTSAAMGSMRTQSETADCSSCATHAGKCTRSHAPWLSMLLAVVILFRRRRVAEREKEHSSNVKQR